MSINKIIKSALSLLSVTLYYNRGSKVIYFHDIHDQIKYAITDHSIALNAFLDLVNTIRDNGFSIVKNITEETDQVRICFDDGYRGLWDCKDKLIEHEIYPTIFVATSLIGKEAYLSSKELSELSNLGFPIQSHTVSHKPLDKMDQNTLRREFEESKQIIESITHKKVDEICFPLGYYNDLVLIEGGEVYSRLFLSIPGNYMDGINKKQVFRILCQDLSPFALKLALFGGQNIFRSHIKKQHYHKCLK